MEASNVERLRKINLIEVLSEELEGFEEEPDDLVERSESEIRSFFRGLTLPQTPSQFHEPDPNEYKRWFPGLGLSGTACTQPKWRVLCFPNAGNTEDMYTSEGTGSRRTASPLLEWCRSNNAECLAVQLPGRNLRRQEIPLESCQKVAEALLPVVASSLAGCPYIVVAHSVGTWCAFELLQLLRQSGLPMPSRAFFSAMAAPNIVAGQRPWRQQHLLPEDAFKEECRSWDVNEVVFSAAMWETYQPLMRADFKLFDQYIFQHAGKPAFEFPITAFWGSKDRKIKESMVGGWRQFTTGKFELQRIEGNHLWPLQAAPKTAWLSQIVKALTHLDP